MRGAAKWRWGLAAALGMAIALAGAGAAWLLGSQGGLSWTLKQLAARGGERLEIEDARGSLARGVTIGRIAWQDDAIRVEAREARLRLYWPSLLVGALRFDRLEIAQLAIEQRVRAASEPPLTLGLPVRLVLDEARIGTLRLRLDAAEEAMVFGELLLSYSGGPREHRLHRGETSTPWGRLSASGSLSAEAPFETRIDGRLTRSGIAVAFGATLHPLASEPIRAMQASAVDVDLAALEPSLPRTRLTLRMEAAGMPLAGRISLDNEQAGSLDRGALPLRELAARFSFDGESVTLEGIEAAAAGGTLSGRGTLQWPQRRARLELRVAGLDLKALRADLRRTALAGTLALDMTTEQQAVRGTLAQQGMRLQADVLRRGPRLDIRALRAEAGGGVLSGRGEMVFGDGLVAKGELAFSGFDPARFGDYPAGSITGSASVAGKVDAPRLLSASWNIARSTLLGRSLASSGQARLQGERVLGVDARLSWGGNRLAAQGALGAPDDQLAWQLDAPALPVEGFSGSVRAHGRASGAWRDPLLHFEATAAPVRIASRLTLDRLAVAGSGTLAAHELSVMAAAPESDARALLAGGWTREAGWQGRLVQLTNRGTYPLDLVDPVPLRIRPNAVALGRLDARLGAGRLQVSQLDWTPAGVASTGAVSGLPAAWLVAAAGIGDTLSATLRLDGEWSLRATPALNGWLRARRASGDLVLRAPEHAFGLAQADLQASFEEGALRATLAAQAELGTLRASARATGLAKDSALELEARLDLADLRALAGPLPANLRVGGRATADLRARGTLGAPTFAGTLRADALQLQLPPYGIYLDRGVLRATLVGDSLRIDELSLRDSSGRFVATGSVPITAAARPAQLQWTATDLQALGRPDLRLVVSGSGTASFEARRFVLKGGLRVERGVIARELRGLPELDADIVVVGREPRNGAPRRPLSLDLDMALDLGERFTVREAGFDGRLTGRLQLTAAPDGALRAVGRVVAADATYSAYGRRLAVDPGIVIFNGPIANPSLQISAWRRNQAVAAGVRITGTLQQPRAQLVSEPPLSEGAKLSWLVLGRGPGDASGADIALLQAAAGALLARGDSVPVTTRLADALGLDELALRGSNELSGRVIAFGKRFSDRIYVSYEQGVGGLAQNLLKIDLLLTERLSLRAQTGTTSGAGVFYRYAWD